jgi:putative restriction endonuclease
VLDDLAVREAAMAYVGLRSTRNGGVVTRQELERFEFAGRQLKLIDQSRGIRNPRELEATISILSQPGGPYDDVMTSHGLLRYAYRAGEPNAGDNRKLRPSPELGLPLILLKGIAPAVFVPVFPVYIARDVPEERYVEVALDESLRFLSDSESLDQRAYAIRLTRQRLHQPEFRARVLLAYETRCAMCRLHHAELLDAAHILADNHPQGTPVVPNGLSLCKIHHAAYDQDFIGVRPDLIIEVRTELLHEADGPMLKHGIQELAGQPLVVPRARSARPDRARLEERYESFRAAG